MTFPASLSASLAKMGVSAANPMQEECLARAAEGRSFALASPTGSGKTLAFLIPAFGLADPAGTKVRAVVLAPTHDLVMQTVRVARELAEGTGLRVGALAGNQSVDRQRETLKKKPHVVVGNPERVALLVKTGKLDLSETALLVLDEADALLAKKAGADLADIRKKIRRDAAVRLFSATYSDFAHQAADTLFPGLEWAEGFGQGTAVRVRQAFCAVSPIKLGEALAKLIKLHGSPRCIVFCARGGMVLEVVRELEKRGICPASIDHYTAPETRKVVWNDLRTGKTPVLVATDSAMRGIDVPGLTHVYHFGLAFDARDFAHRSGRCGRFGGEGLSTSVLQPKEVRTFLEWNENSGVAPEEIFIKF